MGRNGARGAVVTYDLGNFRLYNEPWMIKVNEDHPWGFEKSLNQKSNDASLTHRFEETASLRQTESGLQAHFAIVMVDPEDLNMTSTGESRSREQRTDGGSKSHFSSSVRTRIGQGDIVINNPLRLSSRVMLGSDFTFVMTGRET